MKKVNLLGLFLMLVFVVEAQTTIKDGDEVYGSWTVKGSPYIIEGEAIVPEGKTLVIKPGVEVKFKEGTNFDYFIDDEYNAGFNVGFLRVKGTIIAKGSKSKMIKFGGISGFGNWGVVLMVNSTGNVFEYCHFKRSHFIRSVTYNDNATGAITFIKSDGIVENCIVENSWSGINFKQGSSSTVRNCVIYNNEYGLEANSKSKPTVVNTIVWKNKNAFYTNPGATLNISYCLLQEDDEEKITNNGNNIVGKDPKFGSKFKIEKDSPCYKTGEKKKNIGLM